MDPRPQFKNPWIGRPQNNEARLIKITMRKNWWTSLSSPSFFSPSWKQQDRTMAHRTYLRNLIRGKLIEYTFSSLSLSFSSFHSFFFFLFLTFGYEGKCTGNLLTALFTLALVRKKIWVFDHLVWMFSNKINIFVCKKKKKREKKKKKPSMFWQEKGESTTFRVWYKQEVI